MLLSVSTDCSIILMYELICVLLASTVKESFCSASSLDTPLELLMLISPTSAEESMEQRIMLIVIFNFIDFNEIPPYSYEVIKSIGSYRAIALLYKKFVETSILMYNNFNYVSEQLQKSECREGSPSAWK